MVKRFLLGIGLGTLVFAGLSILLKIDTLESYIAGIVGFGIAAIALFIFRMSEWARLTLGALIGWVVAQFLLWAIGMAIGVPLSVF